MPTAIKAERPNPRAEKASPADAVVTAYHDRLKALSRDLREAINHSKATLARRRKP